MMTVRPATRADADFIRGLVPSFVDLELPSGRDARELASAFARDLEAALAGGAAIFVAEDADGTPLGFIHLQEATDLAGRPRTHVGDVAVSERARGRGVGRALMAFAESRAAERGHERIGLHVFPGNHAARRFYAQLGYETEVLRLTKRVEP